MTIQGPLLEVRGLDVAYGPLQVLFGVDLAVARGEVLALLGTNAAGKSTLLRAVAGLLRPQAGSVALDGADVTGMAAEALVERGMALVPGGRAVFPRLTVADNLAVGTYGFRRDRGRAARVTQRSLELFPALRERLAIQAGLLSGGEQQQLAIAKAMLLEPRLLLIDELSLGLAPVIVEGLVTVVRRLAAEGVTLVLVEQSLNVAAAVADRAVFLEKGKVRFTGRTQELRDRDDLARAVFLGAGAAGP